MERYEGDTSPLPPKGPFDAAYMAGRQEPMIEDRESLLSALQFKIDVIAQSLQPSHQIAFQTLWFQTFEIISAQFSIGRLTTQDVVNRDQDFVRHGDHGAFLPASRFEAIVFLAEVTLFRARGGAGRLDQRRAQVRV